MPLPDLEACVVGAAARVHVVPLFVSGLPLQVPYKETVLTNVS